ncbi:MAG TPA: hypothetical protein VEU62_16825 [Bryobacterales bacterium]|nr:hypothetical protein [Bryobacterales bacterium]
MHRYGRWFAAALAVIMTFPFVCYAQGGGGSPAPTISNVLDAGAYTANIAQGSIFVVFGKNLCGPGLVYGSVPYSSAPLNGTKVTFTPAAGGAASDAYMVYTYGGAPKPDQLAAILPSTVSPGAYNVTVTNNGTASAAFKTTVVANKFGIITVNGSGAGRAVVQNYISATQYDLARYTTGTIAGYTYSPAHPGQIIVIWGTGLGAITGPDNAPPGATDLRGSLAVQVLIDGVPITPDLYAGRAPTYPGTDEIILTLPAGVTTGCLVSLQVSVNGQLSNPTTVAIAGGSDSACIAPGFTTDQLAKLDQGGNFNVGSLAIAGGTDTSASTTIRVDTAAAIFVSLDPDQLQAGTPPSSATKVPNNSCIVTRQTFTPPTSVPPLPAFKLLGPGNVVLNGPNVVNAPLSIETLLNGKVNGVTVVNGAVLTAGTYTVTGPGGKDVGPFQASITLSQPLVVTSAVPNPVPRSKDLTISWTGGGTEQVTITGGSSVPAPGSAPGHPIIDSTQFTCVTTGDKGTFTVPASILQQLPAAKGSITISSNYKMTTFTAPLVAGGNLDYGFFYTGFQSRFSTAFN